MRVCRLAAGGKLERGGIGEEHLPLNDAWMVPSPLA